MVIIVLRFPTHGIIPFRSAFPDSAAGRHPHCSFRGLLKLYSYYGPPDCSPTFPWTLSRGFSLSAYTNLLPASYRI
jgi:hypothetical protein